MKTILVMGSYNVGLTVKVPRIPSVGETIIGSGFEMGPGGKGSNQALAIARLGGDVRLFAKIGSDDFGKQAMELFNENGIDTKYILKDERIHTGAGIIFVDERGANAIGVAPGANALLSVQDLVENSCLFDQCHIMLFQFENQVDVVCEAIKMSKERGKIIVLNPAPALRVEDEYLAMVDVLTPNETEAEILTGVKVDDEASALEAAGVLRSKDVDHVIITLGDKGALYVNEQGHKFYPPFKVEVLDTTGAGDAFNGGLTYSLAKGNTIDESIVFANKVAAYSVMEYGTVKGLPTLRQIDAHFKGARQ